MSVTISTQIVVAGPVRTVQELIDELSKVRDKSRRVVLAGCDCFGHWCGRVEFDRDGELCLMREGGATLGDDNSAEPDVDYETPDDEGDADDDE
jgi:hypothetical protein